MEKLPVKFAVHPGDTISRNDGQRHYIGSGQLLQLYNVPQEMCLIWDSEKPESYRGVIWEKYYHLYPRADGKYELPKVRKIVTEALEERRLDELEPK